MSEKKLGTACLLSIISFITILLNGVWIIINGSPIILSSFKVSSVEEIMNANAFWGRIAFGIPGFAEGYWPYFWLIFAVIILICSILIYKNPRKYRFYGFLAMISSLFSLPIGGGFYVGAILGFIGGASALEWPKSFKETFFGKLIRAVTIDSKFYTMLRDKSETIAIAAFTVIFVSTLNGIGNGLYTYNLNLIKNNNVTATAILLQGNVMWGQEPFVTATSLIGMGVIKWLILSLILYWIGGKITATPLEYDKIARITAFAYVPETIQVFMPLLFSNEPTLSYNWPMSIYVISRIWVFAILVVAIARAFDFPKGKSIGIIIFSGTLYWLLYHMFIIPTLNVPGVEVKFAMPTSSWIILIWVTIAVILALLLGVFKKK